MTDLHDCYTNRKNEFAQQCESIKGKIRKVTFARISAGLLFLVVGYLGFSDSLWWYLLLPLMAVFAFLVRRHGNLEEELRLAENMVRINQLELNALGHDYSAFHDGSEFINTDHAYAYDLDLFGKGSLYQYLDRCGTAIGRSRLAAELELVQRSRDTVEQRQSAVKELAGKSSLRQLFWAQGQLMHDNEEENKRLFQWLSATNAVLGKKWIELLLVVFPILSALLIGLTVYDWKYLILVIVWGGIQNYIISLFTREIRKADVSLTRSRKVFEKYARLLKIIGSEIFVADKLKELHDESLLASGRIDKFSRLVNAFEARNNDIAKLFGNSLYLYDLQCLIRLERWRHENHHLVGGWLDKIAEMDFFNSLATFYCNHPTNTFPIISADSKVSGENMGHPLINPVERVDNTFELGSPQNIMLITGANMAGKSTFLRTVGVNLVLALSGSSVCATRFQCPLVELVTSMRATDSLVEHQSYFYAELSRLKMIMELVRTGTPVFVLLDEILRGTNSNDKQQGSIGLIKQFVSHRALVMLASHDVVLGELQTQFPQAIRNFCFESEIVDEALQFDYTLHPGVAHRANATFLMEKMGILNPPAR